MGKGLLAHIDGDGNIGDRDRDAARKWVISPRKPAKLDAQSHRLMVAGRSSKKKLLPPPQKRQHLVRRSLHKDIPGNDNNNICREWPPAVCKTPEEEANKDEEEEEEEEEKEEEEMEEVERERVALGGACFWKHWSEPSMHSKGETQSHQLRRPSSSALRRSVTHFDVRRFNPMYNGTYEDSQLARLFDSCWIGTKAKEDQQGGGAYQPSSRMLVRVALLNSIIHTVRLIVDYDATVYEVVQAAVRAFSEGPWPPRVVPTEEYSLHMSAFALQSLDPEDRIKWFGSRSFVLCPSKLSQKLD